MGAVLGLCSAAQLACCCGSAACSLCCSACPSCANSTSTRIMYTIMLLLVMVTACITLAPGLHEEMKKVPFCKNSTHYIPGNYKVDCDQAVGYLAVYRICFAACLFFVLMALITLGVKSSKDPRAGIQNGFWGIKYLIVIGGIIGAFFIPEGQFASTWMVFGMIGGFCFIVIQLILIIDFAHSWAERWVSNYEESESRGWYAALLLAMLTAYALALIGIVLLYVYYTKSSGCELSKFFISINLILVVIASGISILPSVQEHQPRSGLLQSAVVSLYVMYLTWSALSNASQECNSITGSNESSFDKQSIIGLVIWVCSVLYSSIRTASSSSKITMSDQILAKEGSAEANDRSIKIKEKINLAVDQYVPCKSENCSCHASVIDRDLAPFKDGITIELFDRARVKATKYQIIDGKLYRENECHFPARCAGVEHYLTALAAKMPDLELALNTRDWPQINQAWSHPKAPVFSFSKTKDYYDIMYPAWSFWEGGPAISLYPTGIGRWDKHRISISGSADKWPWEKKENKGFFRGSRTSEERDALILLSRSDPDLVDAQYTKNQAWKSDMDTLYAPPASEVPFEEHCKYKYLFNYRGVAASFRFKHLFLCKSLVFHVGDQWLEFFYPSLKPWVHYVPISPKATEKEIKELINFFKENDDLANEIADRGFQHIWDHLTDKDVKCYWRKLLKKYAKLVKYDVVKDVDLKLIS